jgi:ribonucleoside-diphosphate reductase alpha chain
MHEFPINSSIASSSKSSIHDSLESKGDDNLGKHLNVIKRNGERVLYNPQKIYNAIYKAFREVKGNTAVDAPHVVAKINQLTLQVTHFFERSYPEGGNIPLEIIQDQVEETLMNHADYPIARAYVVYREKHREKRAAAQATTEPTIQVTHLDGSQSPLNRTQLKKWIEKHCHHLKSTDPERVFQHTWQNLYEGMPAADVNKALIMASRSLVELDPDYSQLTARFLLDSLYEEACNFLNCDLVNDSKSYRHYFKSYIDKGIELELISPALKAFDLEALGHALQIDRDECFSYLSLQTLYDRYFIHSNNIRFELPQAFFMRVAMGLALQEEDKTKRAIEFYEKLSSFEFMLSTPNLFNSGTLRPQLSSCFLTTVEDDLDSIYGGIKDNALLSKFAGGLGNDWTPIRAMGARIKGTNGKSQGVVPFLNVANASAVAVNQGGKRKGAVCAYLENWHLDIEEFLELRKNTGDDRRRTHDMNTANWIPDLFMKRIHEDGTWTLFSPDDTPDLHELYGVAFEKRYIEYETKAQKGEITHYKTMSAINLWRKMLSLLFETGHPWITFKDPCNLRSPQQHVGVVHSSNLCTEITLNTSKEEIAVCNLGSINLAAHLTESGEWDTEKLRNTVRTAMRMLDNVIDINYYTVPQAKHSNLKHRPVGLGLMGFQDILFKKKIAFEDPQTLTLADQSMELISYYAIEASSDLAQERGAYSSFKGSLWDQGILPIDSIELLQEARGTYLDQNRDSTLDWAVLRKKIKAQGMRNSNCLAIAPTATISNICNVTPSIEPIYQNLFVKSNMSGEFTVINPYLVQDLKALKLWDSEMVNALKYYNGSVQMIDRIPQNIKAIYATAFEVDQDALIEAASRRQKWLDQSQSLNLFMAEPSGKKLDRMYKKAWIKGLKTTYYLRTTGRSQVEKATTTQTVLNAVSIDPMPTMNKTSDRSVAAVCSIDDEGCEVCQ